ncbi:membrane-associated 30 kDa protein, chloroplastic [Trifolium repens]|nr:membrane-associated 30 kDa protein, chloroplastic [Trifolium repens]
MLYLFTEFLFTGQILFQKSGEKSFSDVRTSPLSEKKPRSTTGTFHDEIGKFNVEALSPLKEGPDGTDGEDVVNRGEGKWAHWMRAPSVSSSSACKKSDLRLLLGVLGAPLAPVHVSTTDPFPHLSIKDIPILLESKIQEARSKKDNLKARAQSAKTATKVSEMLRNVNTSSALSAFEKMEEKVMTMESQAEALGQLTSDDLEGKFLSYFVARRAFSFLSCLHQADHATVDYVSYAKNLPAY